VHRKRDEACFPLIVGCESFFPLEEEHGCQYLLDLCLGGLERQLLAEPRKDCWFASSIRVRLLTVNC
jgi:hypothetical protein